MKKITGKKPSLPRRRSVEEPLVSIVTVCRNSEATIRRTIESVLHQSYPNIEYIIVDGASTDGTPALIKEYEERFRGRLKWVSEPDRGIYDAMNKGIERSSGNVIGIINSDDWYEPDAVALVVQELSRRGAGVFYGLLRVLEEGNEVLVKAVNPRYLFRESVGHPAYFVSRSVYLDHGGFDLRYSLAGDYELMLRLFSRGVPFWPVVAIFSNFAHGGKSTLRVLDSMKEYARIRFRYGYLSRTGMVVQMVKNNIGFLIQRWSAGW